MTPLSDPFICNFVRFRKYASLLALMPKLYGLSSCVSRYTLIIAPPGRTGLLLGAAARARNVRPHSSSSFWRPVAAASSAGPFASLTVPVRVTRCTESTNRRAFGTFQLQWPV